MIRKLKSGEYRLYSKKKGPDGKVVMGPDGKPELAVERRFVRVGDRRGGQVGLTEGVKAGERIVTSGQLRLQPNSAVVIDPRIQFGRPCLTGTGITTSIIAERFAAGETIAEIAADYDREAADVEEAIRYERLAA